jgi:hypothetical protein
MRDLLVAPPGLACARGLGVFTLVIDKAWH